MKYVRWHLILGLILCLASPAAWANSVTVTTALSLIGLTITAGGDTVIVTPGATTTFAQALDSLGGSSTSSADPASATDSTLASGSAATSGCEESATACLTAYIDLPNVFNGFASSEGDSVLTGLFEIVSGSTIPVTVNFSATLSPFQALQTVDGGQSASSEVIYSLKVPDFGTASILFYDNPLTIGPDSSEGGSPGPRLTNSITLTTNTSYTFVESLDAESYGAAVTPEPSPLVLVLTAAGLWIAFGRRLTTKSRLPARS